MNLKTKLGAALLLAASTSMAQASTYNVTGTFLETMTNGVNTVFKGSFDWNGSTVSNFTGTMNESMRGNWTADPTKAYPNFPNFVGTGTNSDLYPAQNTYKGQVKYISNNGTQMLTLDQNLQQADASGIVTASIFRLNSSDVYSGGGYVGNAMGNMFMKLGSMNDGYTANQNAFFTLVFSHDGLGNITSLGLQDLNNNATLVNQMIYGDCTVGSLMNMMGGPNACMAGEVTGASMMAATPLSLEITQVAAVPVPAAAWLFGGALMSLLGVNRRKNVLSA